MRRFGRNQKRRLREKAAAADALMSRALAAEHELRQIAERLRRLLGPNTAVLEPERVAFEREHRELKAHLDLGDMRAMRPFGDPRGELCAARRTVLMRQLEARIRIDPGPPRSAIHLIAEVRAFGRRAALSRYFSTDEGLSIQSGERFAMEAGRELAEHLHRTFVIRDGRVLEREEKT